jgi:DNA-binding winged helix-turn-helix (wHTH) protein
MTRRTYRIGALALDLSRMCLIGRDGAIELRPKTFELLKYFVEHPGRVISKDELLRAVWPDVNVTEDSLIHCISEVRRAIGPSGQDLIKTVSRRGYMMTATAIGPADTHEPLLPDWSIWDTSVVERADLLRFARAHRLAVVATGSTEGQPQASVVRFVTTDAFELIVDSHGTARKVRNLRGNPKVGVTIGWDNLQTLQIDGLGTIEQGGDLERAKRFYESQFPERYRARQGIEGLVYIRITPSWMRFSDFRHNPADVLTLDFVTGRQERSTNVWRTGPA